MTFEVVKTTLSVLQFDFLIVWLASCSQSHQPHNVASVVQQLQQQQQSPQLSVDASQQVSSSLKESELETTCQSLQKQVISSDQACLTGCDLIIKLFKNHR